MTAPRLVVFLDYQNVYKGARECFHDLSAPHLNGQIHPVKLGEYLAGDSNPDRCLIQVRIYRGLPEASLDPKGFSASAIRGEYDVGILMSTDTDPKPALEEVPRLAGTKTYPRAELAAWSAPGMHSRRLSIPTAKLWCHWLDKRVYDLVRDDTDYSDSAQR